MSRFKPVIDSVLDMIEDLELWPELDARYEAAGWRRP